MFSSFSARQTQSNCEANQSTQGLQNHTPVTWGNGSLRALPTSSKPCRFAAPCQDLALLQKPSSKWGKTNLPLKVNQRKHFQMSLGVSVKVPFWFSAGSTLSSNTFFSSKRPQMEGQCGLTATIMQSSIRPTHRRRPFPIGKCSGMCVALHDLCSTVQRS